jgi:hypothetical protein
VIHTVYLLFIGKFYVFIFKSNFKVQQLFQYSQFDNLTKTLSGQNVISYWNFFYFLRFWVSTLASTMVLLLSIMSGRMLKWIW